MQVAAINEEQTRQDDRERKTMKAFVHKQYGRPDAGVLELGEVDMPVPEDDQVLVRVYASSVNPVEWYGVTGPYFARVGAGFRKPKDPGVGADLAGVVEAVGREVQEVGPGDEVFGSGSGAWAEYAVARATRVALKPANASFEEAATVPIAGLTALQALRDHGQVQPGQKVLVNGASGGVGTFAVQLAKAFGADVTAVCSTRNVEQARALGADRVVDYTKQDFTDLGIPHDLMVDIAGGRSFLACRRALKPDATFVLVGGKMTYRGLGPLPHIAGTILKSRFRSQKMTFFVAKITTEHLSVMRDLIDAGKVRPVIERTYPLGEAREALAYLGEGHARGKIVITVERRGGAGAGSARS
jgi:NADPH:quinone reductase-like Zn-dependent oxidoreductase